MRTGKQKQKSENKLALFSKPPWKLWKTQIAMEALYSAIPDGILAAEIKTGKIVSASPGACRMFGYSEKEFLKKNISDLHPAQEFPRARLHFKKLAQGKQPLASNIPCVKKTVSFFLWISRLVPLF